MTIITTTVTHTTDNQHDATNNHNYKHVCIYIYMYIYIYIYTYLFNSIPIAIPPRWWRWRWAHRAIGQFINPSGCLYKNILPLVPSRSEDAFLVLEGVGVGGFVHVQDVVSEKLL